LLDEDIRDTGDGAFGPPSTDAGQEIYEREREDARALTGVDYQEREERAAEVRTYLYDEWDYLHQSMLKGWCRLFERRLQGEDVGFIREVRRRHAALAYQVRRRFQFIRPEARQRVHRVSDGEEIELDGIIEAVIDRRAGSATDERLYMRRDRALRDVAAAFLLDMSGSTGIAVPTGFFGKPGQAEEDNPALQWARRGLGKPSTNPARRSVIDVAKESLALMCDALETLGDSYAIYGFSGDGRAKVDFLIAKAFEDRLSLRTWAALAAMQPQRATRMGPAIRHAVVKLRPQPTHMKVLIIVSDGYPQDKDYGPDSDNNEYGIQDTAAALRQAEREGVQTFCVTIDPAGYDYLRRMCQKDRYMVIEDVADLPDQLQKVYKALTA
jgi:nitric oxide reductase activation protein